MLLNQVLFWLMITEAIVCLIISLPFGQRATTTVVHFLTSRLRDTRAEFVAQIALALVTVLFLSDVTTCYKHHSPGAILSDGLRIRLLAAQRDTYISGFALFLFLLLRLVYMSTEKNIRLDMSLKAMTKQAEGASAGYKKLHEEHEAMAKQVAKMHALVGGDDPDTADPKKMKKDVISKLVEENTALSSHLEATRKELHAAEKKIETVQKQAEGQNTAFTKLMNEKHEADKFQEINKQQQATIKEQAQEIKNLKKECDSLRSQIQDYDFMFAEAKKKAK